MARFLRWFSFLIAGLVAIPVFATDEPLRVVAGESVVLARSDAILQPKAGISLRGTVVAVTTTASDKRNALLYLAPVGAGDLAETVVFLEGTAERSQQVELAAPELSSPRFFEASFKALFALFIIAVLLESALALLFGWRVFLQLFDGRGMRSLISFVAAWSFISLFELDIVTALINIYSGSRVSSSLPGMITTAMIVAGGSAGVNRLMTTFGFRVRKTAEDLTPKPKPTEAWISVRVRSMQELRIPVDVLMAVDGGPKTVIGSITGRFRPYRWLGPFLRDQSRFPGYGGVAVPIDKPITIWVEGSGKNGAKLPESRSWGPFCLRSGSVIDLEFDLPPA